MLHFMYSAGNFKQYVLSGGHLTAQASLDVRYQSSDPQMSSPHPLPFQTTPLHLALIL